MIRDRNDIEELAHDTAGVDPTPFMQAALDEIVEQLMSGEKVAGLKWTLHDFLGWQEDLHELVMGVRISRDWQTFDAIIEGRLRHALEDDDAVHDLAVEYAQERN